MEPNWYFTGLISFFVRLGFVMAIIFQFAIGCANAQPVTPDSIVKITAEAQGLELVPPDELPPFGTFWLITSGGVNGCLKVPMPVSPAGFSQVYQVADDQFIVDGTIGISATEQVAEAQANAIVNLIDQIEGQGFSHQMSRAMSMDSSEEEGVSGYVLYSIDTNLLWIQITNVSQGMVYANLNSATDQVYAIWSTTNLALPFTNWQVETEVFATDTNCTPFALPTLGRQKLFLRAEDWTDVTLNGNWTPIWWLWKYFGTTDLADTNLDSQGYMLVDDYFSGIDPNTIGFSFQLTNNYLSTTSVQVQLNITAGIPRYYTVVVDQTNLDAATWHPYVSSNIAVNLGTNAGSHSVWIALRGLPLDAQQTWQWKRLHLMRPPLLMLTNPVASTVSQPMIQIYGYCQESLASINYDISNFWGTATGLPSEVTDRTYDAVACDFTTNFFECLDVPLASGLNVVTIHATDLAGNTTVTNFSFTLDYSAKTNPPVVQITWPSNGAQISGNKFTCRGIVVDPTASVTTVLVFTNSSTNLFWGGIYTNTYYALVDRSGSFWMENLPIKSGTNMFTITIKDVLGNTSVTNISVVQSYLSLKINPVVQDSQLWQPTINLTGTISDSTYAIWVNGVKGHNNANGTWFASNVPINSGGTASFTATAYSPTEQQPDGSYGN